MLVCTLRTKCVNLVCVMRVGEAGTLHLLPTFLFVGGVC